MWSVTPYKFVAHAICMPLGRASPTLSCATMDRRACCCCLLAVALTSYLAVVTESCPSADSVSPATGSADPSFVYTISGAELNVTDVNVTSPAGSLNYTAVNDSTIRFSFETGSSARGRVVVTLTAPLCSAVDITVLVTIPCKLLTYSCMHLHLINPSYSCSYIGRC